MDSKFNVKGKRVFVVGMGTSGMAAVSALVREGAEVAVQDSKKEDEMHPRVIEYLEGKDVDCFFGTLPSDSKEYDYMVLSPGVPPNLPFIREAAKAGVEIMGELELAYRLCEGTFYAITGTNGKTTATSLVGDIFKAAGEDTCVVGNIGTAVVSQTASATEDTRLVTEVSSFQLETISTFKPHIALILNLTPDHMDRHKTMQRYGETKARVFENQSSEDYAIVNYDDTDCYRLAKGTKAKIVPFSRQEELEFGAFVKDDKIVVKNEDGKLIKFCGTDELKIPGTHNLENALGAAAMAYFAGINPKIITKTLKSFAGVEHRIEFCEDVNGIRYVNDSKGTNTDAAIKAIEAMKGKIVLIAGGYDKGAEYEDFVEAFGDKVKNVVLIGKTAVKIKDTAEKMGYTNTLIVEGMEDAVREASALASAGDTVLLSPACASWDMYANFEKRGEHFKECVRGLRRVR